MKQELRAIVKVKEPPGDKNIPLVVDLDGTLIHTDVLYEGFIMLMKKNLLNFFLCIGWLLRGKTHLKAKIFERVQLRCELLPYNTKLLKFLQTESDNGRKLILATASVKSIALDIAKLYPIFDEVYGTENSLNLKGEKKREVLVKQFGEGNFDYIGNSTADLKIFSSARFSYLVSPSKSLERKTRKVSTLKHIWNDRKASVGSFIRAIRAYQWIKNLLIFVPLITSHSFDPNLFYKAALAFVSFCLVASSGYLINDLSDLNADRSHPRKRYRPLASGKLSILYGGIIAVIFMAAGIFIAAQELNNRFLAIVISYLVLSLAYSLYLKKTALYDVFLLALLYSIRVIAGTFVIAVPLSFWLISFSTFIFLSLAFVKRYSELIGNGKEKNLVSRRRQYSTEDLQLLQIMGIVSGFMSVVVFSLYVNSPEVVRLYSKPKALGALCFLFLFWISRIWLYTIRGKMTDDPIIFAMKDILSYFIFALIGVVILIAT